MWSILQVPVPVCWTQSEHNWMVPVHFAWPPCTYAAAGCLFMRAFAKKRERDRKYNKQQMVELFPSADSVITFPANPIGSIRLECFSNVRLSSGRISCCGSSAVCAYMGASMHRCTCNTHKHQEDCFKNSPLCSNWLCQCLVMTFEPVAITAS